MVVVRGQEEMMNVYSDADKTAISYLWNHMDELPSFHYMGGQFNVHPSIWDPEVTHHPLLGVFGSST